MKRSLVLFAAILALSAPTFCNAEATLSRKLNCYISEMTKATGEMQSLAHIGGTVSVDLTHLPSNLVMTQPLIDQDMKVTLEFHVAKAITASTVKITVAEGADDEIVASTFGRLLLDGKDHLELIQTEVKKPTHAIRVVCDLSGAT